MCFSSLCSISQCLQLSHNSLTKLYPRLTNVVKLCMPGKRSGIGVNLTCLSCFRMHLELMLSFYPWLKPLQDLVEAGLIQDSGLLNTILPSVFQIISLYWLGGFWLQIVENLNQSGLRNKKCGGIYRFM